MKTTIIVAVAQDGAIGDKGDLIWHIGADLKHFKTLTMGHSVVMGRRTWESLPGGALPGRRNIVVTRNADYRAEGAQTVSSLAEALALCREAGEDNAFVIGGATIYRAAIEAADVLELTEVEASYPDADTRFPEYDASQWRLVESSERMVDAKSGLAYTFKRFERI